MDRESSAMTPPWSLILLTGGIGSRLGLDKSNVAIGARTTAQRIIDDIPPEVAVTVVGPTPDHLGRDVTVTQEVPPGGGPAAGIAAGLALTDTDVVGVLATDMPFAAPVLPELFAALKPGLDGVLAVDSAGRQQYLCAIYRTAALRTALSGEPNNVAMRSILADLTLGTVPMDERVMDIDTPDDLERARGLAGLPNMREK
jgi:molybdopterin-guanine dinucleotide biosynthesis protein A